MKAVRRLRKHVALGGKEAECALFSFLMLKLGKAHFSGVTPSKDGANTWPRDTDAPLSGLEHKRSQSSQWLGHWHCTVSAGSATTPLTCILFNDLKCGIT